MCSEMILSLKVILHILVYVFGRPERFFTPVCPAKYCSAGQAFQAYKIYCVIVLILQILCDRPARLCNFGNSWVLSAQWHSNIWQTRCRVIIIVQLSIYYVKISNVSSEYVCFLLSVCKHYTTGYISYLIKCDNFVNCRSNVWTVSRKCFKGEDKWNERWVNTSNIIIWKDILVNLSPTQLSF